MKDANKDAINIASIINQMRITGLSFIRISEFKAEYVKAGGKIIDPVTSFLVKNNILTKKDKKIVFNDYTTPIYYAGIAKIIKDNRQKQRSYHKKKENTVLEKINTNVESVNDTQMMVESVNDTQMMIDTLKSRGYKVLKPVTQYEEV